MYALLALALAGQLPAPDHDFVTLSNKVDAVNASVLRAERTLGRLEDKVDGLARVSGSAAPAADDNQPWYLSFRVEDDGREHFYVRDAQGRSRHFARPGPAAAAPAVRRTVPVTTVLRYTTPPAAAAPYYAAGPAPAPADCPAGTCAPAALAPAAAPGYFSGFSPVYTGVGPLRRGLFGGGLGGGACAGGNCSP